jgi:hypothetical protein
VLNQTSAALIAALRVPSGEDALSET